MFFEGTIIAPPTITPCSAGAVELALFPEPALLFVVLMVLESAPLTEAVPESEQEIIVIEKTKAVANTKIGLRVIVVGFND
jgi:hypothetical protein